jgi:DNA polymerase III subunit delta'
MSFFLSSIIGQKRVVDTLKKFIQSNQIPHAMLFSGPKNVGQHQTAKYLIKELLAINIPEKNFNSHIDKLEEPVIKFVIPLPRGKSETPDDMPLAKLTTSDLDLLQEEIGKKIENSYYEIYLEKANNIKINSIRDIKKNISINYDDLPYRLILIEEAHLMSIEAQNALLKSLEEPPEGVIFILVTDKPEILLTTTKSRCWEIPFAPLQNKDIEFILINNFNIDSEKAQKVIPFAEGSIHKVFELLNYGFENLLDTSIDILRYSLGRKYNTAIKLFNSAIEEKPKIVIPIIIQLLIAWFNDVQKVKLGLQKIHFSGYKETIEKFVLKFDSVKLDEIIFDLTELRKNIDYNINLNLVVLNTIFDVSAISKR